MSDTYVLKYNVVKMKLFEFRNDTGCYMRLDVNLEILCALDM